MEMHPRRIAAAIFVALLGFGFPAVGQEPPKAGKQAPTMTPEIVGQEMFRSYCASCHGLDGRGKGPAASALKKQPPDLTLLSREYGGKFPRSTVSSVIEGTDFVTEHGSRDMPIWGNAFRQENQDESMVKLKVRNLTAYIKSLQQK